MRLARFWKPATAPVALTAALLLALALAMSACKSPDLSGPTVARPIFTTPTPGSADPDGSGSGQSDDPGRTGVTDDSIRVGVIADVSGAAGFSVGSEAAWLAMRAWAQAVNSSGGLGGRDVEVVLFDANVFGHRAAVQEACESDIFALVGSHALFDGAGVDLLNDESCRLPDFPAAALSPERRESPVTFVSNPTSNTVGQAGPAQFLSDQFPAAAGEVGAVVLDLPVVFYQSQREIEAGVAGGFELAFQTTAELLDEDYDALASAMAEADVEAITWSADRDRLLSLLEARARLYDQDPGLSPDDLADGTTFVLCNAGCYSQSWAAEAAEVGPDLWVSIGMLPFEEPGDNVELVRYVLFLREEVDQTAEVDLIGLSSWASALLFEEAVSRAMFISGGGLSRELVIDSASTITSWDGRGLHGPTNPGDGIPSPCFVLMSPTASGWVRRHPATPGTMDCDPDNLVELVDSATLGVEPAQPDSADSPGTG